MRRIFVLTFLVVVIVGGLIAFRVYKMIQAPNVRDAPGGIDLLLPDEGTFEGLLDSLEKKSVLINRRSFERVASWMNFEQVNGGRYLLDSKLSNRALVNVLRSSSQTPVDLTINNVRMLPELGGMIAEQIELDSAVLIDYLGSNEALEYFGTTSENVITYFIPETYEVFWNMNSRQLIERMKREHEKFWSSENRRVKAKQLGLSEEEVYTIASIVEKEAHLPDERDTVARLYLNRIDLGMPLQADPTVVFATGKFDLRRVLFEHLKFDSPYNTYKYPGLPPGPICMPAINSIDAVLNAPEHDYIYMCASPAEIGRHAFASTSAAHGRNARRYHAWLDARGIR